jgi:TOTE conflict system primase-like protein
MRNSTQQSSSSPNNPSNPSNQSPLADLTDAPAAGSAAAESDLETLLRAWESRFLNRVTPHALQRPDGSYRWVFRRCDPTVVARHLGGELTLAVASLDAGGGCRWACVDADADGTDGQPDGVGQLVTLARALSALGLAPPLLEASRRGGHLWLFFDAPVPAALARSVVRGVLRRLRTEDGLDLARLELYPDADRPGALGHAVRLPLGIHRRTGARYPLLDATGRPLRLTRLLDAVHHLLAHPASSRQAVDAAARTVATWDGVGGPVADAPAGREEREAAQGAMGDVGAGVAESARPVSPPAPVSTTSAAIRWVDAQVSPLDLLAELAPRARMRRTGQGYLGWCPFHDDEAPQADGSPGTPSLYVVCNRRHGWSWRCLSSNCAHHAGPMRHSFRLFQELRGLGTTDAIRAAVERWPEVDGLALSHQSAAGRSHGK